MKGITENVITAIDSHGFDRIDFFYYATYFQINFAYILFKVVSLCFESMPNQCRIDTEGYQCLVVILGVLSPCESVS
jgi:hypothetical protein